MWTSEESGRSAGDGTRKRNVGRSRREERSAQRSRARRRDRAPDGDGLGDFAEWIALHIERKARIDWEGYVDIARLGAALCLMSGVTTVGDCSYSGATAVACADLGLRATVYLEVFGSDPARSLEHFAEIRERVEGSFSERVRPGISPHAPYSVSLELFQASRELGLPVATHISESPAEVRYLLTGEGPWGAYSKLLVDPPRTTGTRMLARHGLLGPDVVAAHCVMLDEEEIGLISSTGTGVAHCPRSNAALGCGVAPLAELREAGARVGVGTDSPASAPSFDFFEELRSVVLSARARAARPDVLSATEALELATLGSAGLWASIPRSDPSPRANVRTFPSSHSPDRPIYPGRIPPARSCSAARPTASLRRTWTGKRATREEVPSGTS